MMRFNVTFNDTGQKMPVKFNESRRKLDASFKNFQTVTEDLDVYTGQTTVVPSEVQQILQTDGKKIKSDVIIEPIPSNYGRIIWNGSTMTIV